MKPSSRTEYALRAMLDLALHRNEAVSNVADIAQRQHIPAKFLEHILLGMKAGGLVTSRRGARGGYVLAREPSAITVGDIVRLSGNSFSSATQTKGLQDPLGDIWEDIGDYARKKLATITLQDVCTRFMELRQGKASEYAI